MRHSGGRRSFGSQSTDSRVTSRRSFLAGAGAAAAGLSLFRPRPAAAQFGFPPAGPGFPFPGGPPSGSGSPGRRYVIKGGAVMSMDPAVGDFPQADVLVEGKKIVAIAPNIHAGGADVIDATGRVVMPGFIDTHHHQFETALRSFLADGVLILDGGTNPESDYAYYQQILLGFAPVYRPEDVYISEVVSGLSQLDDGVTTVHDVSQIHHTPQHSDAAVQALFDTGKRAVFGYFEGAGEGAPPNGVVVTPGYAYPQDARRLKKKWFSSSDQLVTMIMGGEVYLGDDTTVASWTIGRELDLQIAAHILSPFGIAPIFDRLAGKFLGGDVFTNIPTAHGSNIPIGPDNLFIHMTGMSDVGWQAVHDQGAQVSLAVPIEMNMRHGMPPILRLQSLGMEPSLSIDVECTLTADFFTQMRAAMNQQRAIVNQMTLDLGSTGSTAPDPRDWGLPGSPPANQWPSYPNGQIPQPLTTRDVLRFATLNGAKALRLDNKVGSLTPGKEADIIILDATRINVMPLNQAPGAVVSLMDRTNVETVIVAGKVRKWKGQLLDVRTGAPLDLTGLRSRLEASRDYLFAHAFNNIAGNTPGAVRGVPKDLFRSN